MEIQFAGISARVDDLTPEQQIAHYARVSSPNNQFNNETAPKLLKYLIEHKHWSPFEMVDMTVRITTSRAIAAQILRHKSFSFQEFSQRYAPVDSGYEQIHPRRVDTKNRQNSFDDLSRDSVEWFQKAKARIEEHAQETYQQALDQGIAKESARFLLPMSVRTHLYMKGSVRSWIHYLQVRMDPSTQYEHREIAVAIYNTVFQKYFPNIALALGMGEK